MARYCKRCGHIVEEYTQPNGYFGTCPECYEDLYGFETMTKADVIDTLTAKQRAYEQCLQGMGKLLECDVITTKECHERVCKAYMSYSIAYDMLLRVESFERG